MHTDRNPYGHRDLMSYSEAWEDILQQLFRGNAVGDYGYSRVNDEWNRALDHIREGLGDDLRKYQKRERRDYWDLRKKSEREIFNKI